ncbi:MAG TPA: ATP-binding cassette domain-containing protein [Caldilineaceae bacterium]|nr:ATP-binding cassette domain-containing protein [Caldilineaceae bacterium]
MHHTVEIENLHFCYPDGRQALRGVTLTIPPNVKMMLVGPNGAGKSTLMLHLNGILQGKGQVRVAGLEVVEKNLPQVRASVGMVFQNPDDQLFSLSVYDDVAFGPLHMGLDEAEVRQRVAQALAAVGMEGYEERAPHHLSMGEKKRIAIATVLAMAPEILVLDEPSAGLDPRARRSLIELLKRLEMTMLISTHDMGLVAELGDCTAVMDHGQVVACGPTAAILADHALLERHGLVS